MSSFLTKSKFKLALECPTKVHYASHQEYPNTKQVDPFLQALAEGGFQVGELAKCYYPDGIYIDTKDEVLALELTDELLKRDEVVIFEAAILHENMFVRVDILEKIGDVINIIEVMSKSADFNTEDGFLNKSKYIVSEWKPYLYDLAFQTFVAKKRFVDSTVIPYLMLADKTSVTSIDGLNQKFIIERSDTGKLNILKEPGTNINTIGDPILCKIASANIVERLIVGTAQKGEPDFVFEQFVSELSTSLLEDEKISPIITVKCLNCEFDCKENGKSGKMECFSEKIPNFDFSKPTVNEVWNYRKKQKVWESGRYYMESMTEDDFISNKKEGLTPTAVRQLLQVTKTIDSDKELFFDKEMMGFVMSLHKYPLHFIDFETSMVAIPFNSGRRPYEQIAFQFSHHILHEDGLVEHRGQYINTERGEFPNYNFVRALYEELRHDEGHIFKYAVHENTVLNAIYDQLEQETESTVPDKDELMKFITTITNRKDSEGISRHGERDMIDMCEMVKTHYYSVMMGGSNSIKAVLPAVLNSSNLIQDKYSKPIYGKWSELPSLNYEPGWVWIKKDGDGKVINPYKLLPTIGGDDSSDDEVDEINNGGAAMTAYARMQFSNMSQEDFDKLRDGLLRYCELDTLAMVMIYEHWKELLTIKS